VLTSTTIHTAHGYSIRVRRVGVEIELETSHFGGDAISTVRMSEDEARALLSEMGEEMERVW
jgi:hypothetical protein